MSKRLSQRFHGGVLYTISASSRPFHSLDCQFFDEHRSVREWNDRLDADTSTESNEDYVHHVPYAWEMVVCILDTRPIRLE